MSKDRQRTSSRRHPRPSRTRGPAPGPAQDKERLPWRVRLRRTAITLLLAAAFGPPLLLFVYRIVPPPLPPLMLIRLFEGAGLERDWVPIARHTPALPGPVLAGDDNPFHTATRRF